MGDSSLEKEVRDWLAQFTIDHGRGHTDPVWGGQGHDYTVLQHEYQHLYLYLNQEGVIEFLVDGSNLEGELDTVVYYPKGLAWDHQTTTGVWDFSLKHGRCPERQNDTEHGLGIHSHSLNMVKASTQEKFDGDMRPMIFTISDDDLPPLVGGHRTLFPTES